MCTTFGSIPCYVYKRSITQSCKIKCLVRSRTTGRRKPKVKAGRVEVSLCRMRSVQFITAIMISNGLLAVKNRCRKVSNRDFFYWLTIIFNRIDQERIQAVGSDRACAEWLLKNGASVKWIGFTKHLKDYNSLPSEENLYYIQAVDATDSGITHVGFPYFVGCRYIDEIKLVRCFYLYNSALPLLSAVKDSLTTLEIRDCKSITDEGVRSLKDLKNLKNLKIAGIPYLEDKTSLRKELAEALPNCIIELE